MLPRFCLENYLCDPAELWDGLPAVKQEQVEGGRDRLTDSIGRDLDRFVRHCALWKTVTPLWTGLRALGFKEVLASEDSLEASQNDDKIRQTLDGWHELLDPNRLFDEFQQALQQASSASDHEKFSRLIHGKLFWKAQVHPVLNRLLGQASAPERRNALFQTLPRPADLKAILRELSVTAGT